jgi:aryl-alcohol dehydrogenase-like predicted oxidoreductase
MRRLELANTERSTTQLGFGCAYIFPENRDLISAAFDAGIRHFDVARAYGRGLSEACLGKTLKGRASEVTITSKFGIWPPYTSALYPVLRAIVRRARPHTRRPAGPPSPPAPRANAPRRKADFAPAEASKSLEESLRKLGLDRVDVLLLHEATADDLGTPALHDFLETCVATGRIGTYGVGGESGNLPDLVGRRSAYCRVLQYDWTPVEPVVKHANAFQILFRCHSRDTWTIQSALEADPARQRRWSETVGVDLAEPRRLASLLLKAALDVRPDDLILFSSASPRSIEENVRIANDASLNAPALRLVKLLRRECAAPL